MFQKRSTSTIVLDNCTPDPVEYDFNSDTMQRVYDSIDYGEGSSYEGEIIETTRVIETFLKIKDY